MAIRLPLFLIICANCRGRYSTWPIKGNTSCYELHLVRVAGDAGHGLRRPVAATWSR